tara:strand:+ start:84 stop:572 length:489 start_codon:yes stop_codon:yes gene_type:complete
MKNYEEMLRARSGAAVPPAELENYRKPNRSAVEKILRERSGSAVSDEEMLRMRSGSAVSNEEMNLGALPEYTGDGDPMDDSLRAEGPTIERLERLMSFGIPFDIASSIADFMPPVETIGSIEEEKEIALDLQNMLLNEMSGNVDPAVEASPVEMDMRENYTR